MAATSVHRHSRVPASPRVRIPAGVHSVNAQAYITNAHNPTSATIPALIANDTIPTPADAPAAPQNASTKKPRPRSWRAEIRNVNGCTGPGSHLHLDWGTRLAVHSDAANAALGAASRIDQILAQRSATLASLTAPVARSIATEQTRRKTLAHSDGGATNGNTFYGTATWYGWADWGNSTASGEKFNPNAMTCASPWLPFGTMLKVTLLENGRSVVVRVNDRGPFGGGVIDLTEGAAKVIGMVSMGVGNVRVQVLS